MYAGFFSIAHTTVRCALFAGITWRTIVGWLITIAAISLGAPFWFDLLGKIAHLRASGRNRPLDSTRAK